MHQKGDYGGSAIVSLVQIFRLVVVIQGYNKGFKLSTNTTKLVFLVAYLYLFYEYDNVLHQIIV